MSTDTRIAVLVGLGVLVLWAGSGLALYMNPDRGTFGDMFGAINALFSGLAFAGVIYAILLQRKELELQRQELVETRKEIQRAAAAQEESAQFIHMQAVATHETFQLQHLTAVKDSLEKQMAHELMQSSGNMSQKYLRLLDQQTALEKKLGEIISKVVNKEIGGA